jgi:large subunit ribosomal protein L24
VPNRLHIRKNDQVEVLSGKDRGKRGRVLRIMPARSRAIVERINMLKRHTRPNPQRNIKGGVVEREASLHASNCDGVPVQQPTGSATTFSDGRKVCTCLRRVIDKQPPGKTSREHPAQ